MQPERTLCNGELLFNGLEVFKRHRSKDNIFPGDLIADGSEENSSLKKLSGKPSLTRLAWGFCQTSNW